MHITRNIWHSVGGLKWQSQLYFTHLYPSRFVPECKVNLKLVRICVPASAWQIPSLDIYLHSALRVVLVLMFFMSATFFFPLKSRLKGSKDEMLLDMINKQRTSVNVCSYTHWMTGCNWLQPVWCNKAHYYANPSGPGDSNVVCCGWVREREREGEKRQSRKCETEREKESKWMAACQCDRTVFLCTPVCPIEKPVTQKQQPPWSSLLSQHCLSSGWHLKTSSQRTKD